MIESLTPAQRRVYDAAESLAARHRPTHLREVAEAMGLSQNTVRLHRAAIEAKGLDWPASGREECLEASRKARRRFDPERWEASMAEWRRAGGARIHGDEWAARQGRTA